MAKRGPKARDIDWVGIEADYCAGVKSLPTISGQYGVSIAYLHKKANAEGWVRDLSAKVRKKTGQIVEAEIAKAEKSGTGSTKHYFGTEEDLASNKRLRDDPTYGPLYDATKAFGQRASAIPKSDENAIIEVTARAGAAILLSHRSSIGRARGVFDKLLGELEQVTDASMAGLFQKAYEVLTATQEGEEPMSAEGKAVIKSMIKRAAALPERASTMAKLMESLNKIVALERQAIGADVTPPPPPPGSMSVQDVFDKFEEGVERMRQRWAARAGIVPVAPDQAIAQVTGKSA